MEAAMGITEWLTWLTWASWPISIAIYIYLAICLQTIARKTDTEHGWLAWIPIANLYLMCKIAGRSGWWLLLFFIPIVNIVFWVIVWMGIAKARDKKGWLGLLMLVPIANLIIPGYLAFSGGDTGAERLEAQHGSIALAYMALDGERTVTGGATPQPNLTMPGYSNYAGGGTVVSAREIQAEGKAREAQQPVADIGSKIHEKTVQLVIPLSATLSQVAQFKEHLAKVKDLTIVMIGGSVDKGSIITVSPHESTDLIRILNQIPVVESAHRKGEDIIVELKPPGAVKT